MHKKVFSKIKYIPKNLNINWQNKKDKKINDSKKNKIYTY